MADRNHTEKKEKKSKIRNAAHKDESSITFYLHASLFLFFLTTYAFLQFLDKNKYPLILNNEILPEVLFFCFGLLIFSFLSLFLLSFWRFLARVFIATVAGGVVAYILGLLFPFNIGNYLSQYASFLPPNILSFVATNGNMIVAGVAGLVFFILLNMFKGGAMALLSLPVLAAIFLLLNTASKQTIPVKIQTPDATSDRENEKTENLIYLILADHASYGLAAESWQNLNAKTSNNTVELPFSPAFIASFYQSNNFTFYPSAYLRFQDKYRNIENILNPTLTEIGNDLFDSSDAVYYVSSEDAKVSTTRNDLFKALKQQGYHLNVYQSYPFDFCKGAGAKEIASCVTYPAPLGALYQTNISTPSRLLLLFGHWLYSTPFGKDVANYAYNKAKEKIDPSALPILGNPMSKSLPIGQSLILSRLRQDVLTAQGKNVFFAHLNLPHYPYVYDKNCQLRVDPLSWRSNAPYTEKKELNGELKRWEDYNQQLFCAYAQINYLIKDLEKAKLLNKTTIVIHGDKGAGISKEKTDENDQTRVDRIVTRFKSNRTTVFGIYTPKNKAQIKTTPCDIATLVDRHVLKNTADVCMPPDFTSYTQEEQDKSMAWFSAPIAPNYLKKTDFKPLYTSWLEKGGEAFMGTLDERLKKENQNASSSKISFVAPPSFSGLHTTTETEAPVKEKTTDFVPVPEKNDFPPTQEPAPQEPKVIELHLPSADVLPTVQELSVQEPPPPAAEPELPSFPVVEPEALPFPVIEQEKREKTAALDVIADDLGELPKPIALPESSAQDKWKATNIKEGQKTTLELLPKTEEKAKTLQTEPAVSEVVPQAAPAAQVEILPLPTPEIVEPVGTTEKKIAPKAKQQEPNETAEVKAAKEARAQAEAQVQAKANEEAQAIAAAEAQIKAAEEAKAKLEALAQARAQAEAEAKARAEEEAKLRAEEEERIKTEAEAQIKAAEEAKAKVEAAAQARAQAEAEAKAKADEVARIKAEEEERVKAEAEAQIKAAKEAQAKARAEARAAKAREEEEERRRLEEEEREEMRKKTPPPPPANADELDIVKETTIERVNDEGEIETFIYLERKPNPKRFKKKPQEERELQQNLSYEPVKQTTLESTLKPEENMTKTTSAPAPELRELEQDLDRTVKTEPPKQETTSSLQPVAVPATATSERELDQEPELASPQPMPEKQTEQPAKKQIVVTEAAVTERVLED